MPKNGISSEKLKILRPLLQVQHPPKIMELPLVLGFYHFWVGFEPIFEFGISLLVFYIISQKNMDFGF